MNPILIAGPAVEPVSVANMRAFLRLDDAAEDELIAALVKTARQAVEAAAGRLLIAQTWRVAIDRWPHDGLVVLPLSPLLAVETIQVFDAAGVATLLTSTQYRADALSDPPRIVVEALAPQPARAPGGIEVEVRLGYGASTDAVPPPLRQAVRMLAAHWFEHRGDETGAPPPDVLALIAPFRRARL
jgi:uncharacterized phiE125 gp8 family phage protein